MADSKAPRGALIVFEGLDRAGKSTQHARTLESLRRDGRKVVGMRFPDRSTPTGKLIDEYLRGESEVEDHVVHLLFCANRWEVATKIEALLTSGTTVLLDRYIYSGAVYSAAKQNPLLDLDWARASDVNLPAPDLVVFLEISQRAAANRGGFGGERYEESTMQARVRDLFAVVGKMQGSQWKVIDAGRGIDEVEAEVGALVKSIVEDVEHEKRKLRRVER